MKHRSMLAAALLVVTLTPVLTFAANTTENTIFWPHHYPCHFYDDNSVGVDIHGEFDGHTSLSLKDALQTDSYYDYAEIDYVIVAAKSKLHTGFDSLVVDDKALSKQRVLEGDLDYTYLQTSEDDSALLQDARLDFDGQIYVDSIRVVFKN